MIDLSFYCATESYLNPITEMQKYLRFISSRINEISNVVPDGIFGETTEESVKSFQKYFGLTENGIIDYQTWELIVFVYNRLIEMEKTE